MSVTDIQVTGTILNALLHGVIGAHQGEELLQGIELGGAGAAVFPVAQWDTGVGQEDIVGVLCAAALHLLRDRDLEGAHETMPAMRSGGHFLGAGAHQCQGRHLTPLLQNG